MQPVLLSTPASTITSRQNSEPQAAQKVRLKSHAPALVARLAQKCPRALSQGVFSEPGLLSQNDQHGPRKRMGPYFGCQSPQGYRPGEPALGLVGTNT